MSFKSDKGLQFRELSLSEHAPLVLDFFEHNREFFLEVENRLPDMELVEESFAVLPEGVQPHQKQVFGVFRDERLIAFIELIQDRHRAKEWLLSLFVIDIDERGQGLGRRIMNCLEAHLGDLGVSCLILGVVESNASALAFWAKLDFIPVEKAQQQVVGGRELCIRVFYKEFGE